MSQWASFRLRMSMEFKVLVGPNEIAPSLVDFSGTRVFPAEVFWHLLLWFEQQEVALNPSKMPSYPPEPCPQTALGLSCYFYRSHARPNSGTIHH